MTLRKKRHEFIHVASLPSRDCTEKEKGTFQENPEKSFFVARSGELFNQFVYDIEAFSKLSSLGPIL